jgi:predicted metal-dependent hydrolase
MSKQPRRRSAQPVDKYTLKKRAREWAGRIGVQPKELHVRTMTTKWASCSTAGRVTFSSDLLYEPAAFRDYVIVHELLHLQVPNHGKLFKSLLNAFLPNWEKIVQRRPNSGSPSLGLTRR